MFTSTNPATGEVIQTYATWSDKQLLEAIDCSQQAFSPWAALSFTERAKYLQAIAECLSSHRQSAATMITNEMGKPRQAALAELDKCSSACRYYAEHAATMLAKQVVDEPQEQRSFVCYQPLGVIFGIMPWNYPFWQVFRFIAPTLMAGNVAVLSHAPSVSGCSLMIEQLLLECGLPPGVFQSMLIETAQAAQVIAHDAVKAVTLTGSVRAGSAVAALAGQAIKKVLLELGGSDPYLVLDDADLAHAAECIVTARLTNAGQVCISAKRVIATEPVLTALIPLIRKRMMDYQPGDPQQMGCTMGPMARADLRETVHRQVQHSIAMGAHCLDGGVLPTGPGFYYPPTLLTEVSPGMSAFDQELFGPVISLVTAKDEQHAIALANQTPFGLGAAVFTRDLAKGEYIASECLQAGVCFVNEMVSSRIHLPFGGVNHSGFGRELGEEGIKAFVNIKAVVVSTRRNIAQS